MRRRRRRRAGRRESVCKKWGEGRALRLDVPIRRDRDSSLPLLDVVYFVPKVLLLKWRCWCEKVTASAPATRPSVHPLVCPFVRLDSTRLGSQRGKPHLTFNVQVQRWKEITRRRRRKRRSFSSSSTIEALIAGLLLPSFLFKYVQDDDAHGRAAA